MTATLDKPEVSFWSKVFSSSYPFLFVALLVRLYAIWQTPVTSFVIDEAEYYRIASMLADGRGWAYYETALWVRPPLYPLFLAGLFLLGGHNLVIVKLVQICLSVASVFLLATIAGRTLGKRSGIIAGWLAALAWPFAVFSLLLLSETLFLFLFLLSFYFLLLALEKAGLTIPPASPTLNSSSTQTDLPPSPLPTASAKPWLVWVFFGLAGFCLGLTALTRGQVLSFVPLVGLWVVLFFGLHALHKWKQGLLFALTLLLAFGLTLAPWLARNFVAYGRPLLDTTGGYNLYLGAQAARNEVLVNQTLEAVPNQAERETLAYRKAIDLILANPGGWLAKGVKESNDFWIINFGAEERLEDGYTKGYIGPGWLVAGQLLGDTLYVGLGALALLGLLVAGTNRAAQSFVALWLSYNLVLAFVFFAVSRFRWPVFYLLLIFAAYVLAHPRQVWEWLKLPLSVGRKKFSNGRWAALALPILFLVIVLPTYQPAQTVRGLEEWARYQHSLQADDMRRAGNYAAALQEYAQASQYNQVTLVGLALTEASLGRYSEAETRLLKINQDFAAVHLALGWLYQQQGQLDFASAEFRSRQIALDQGNDADDWAWQNLPVKPLAANTLKIGEFDWGYVEGFWFFERENSSSPWFRWTAGRDKTGQAISRLKFPPVSGPLGKKPQYLTLRLRNYRPAGLPLPEVEIRANGQILGKLKPGLEWRDFTLALPPDLPATQTLVIELRPENTFVPDAKTKRELGLMVQWAALL